MEISKPSLLALTLSLPLLMAPEVRAQGTVNFNTAVSPATRITFSTGQPIDGTLNPNARAGLYAGYAGSTEAQLQLISPVATFGSGALAGYISAGSRTITFIPQGYQNAVVQVRVWGGASVFNSYEAAVASGISTSYGGKSQLYTITGGLGGPGSSDGAVPPATAANIPGQVGFVIFVPEPSIVTLGLLSLGFCWRLHSRRTKSG